MNSTNPVVANAIACRTTVCNASVPSEIVTYVKTLEQASALIDKVRSSNRSIVRKIESLPEGSSERIAAAKMFNAAHENARYVSMDMCVTGVDIPSRY